MIGKVRSLEGPPSSLARGAASEISGTAVQGAAVRAIEDAAWYSIDAEQLEDEFLRSHFVQCELDAETQAFLDRSTEKSNWLGTQILHAVARLFLGWFLTKTTLNGPPPPPCSPTSQQYQVRGLPRTRSSSFVTYITRTTPTEQSLDLELALLRLENNIDFFFSVSGRESPLPSGPVSFGGNLVADSGSRERRMTVRSARAAAVVVAAAVWRALNRRHLDFVRRRRATFGVPFSPLGSRTNPPVDAAVSPSRTLRCPIAR
ncbi:hypothetical protein HPB49_009557 [Dermacentor silvarum]|uniref:Uncharacterized protein n=1 Tax=Dermacentor silvarum TaxID=543639 RepID=A0ACB8DY66_DERSI|nr:hypothetical protein HPB49_009557 [Dermacentor silvarum]